MPEYSHTLIPSHHEFVPEPMQVGGFLTALALIGAAPECGSISLATLTGKVRKLVSPFSGTTDVYPEWRGRGLSDISMVSEAIGTLCDYDVVVTGKGPPKSPAFAFDFTGTYDFIVRCCRRGDVVSMSDWHDEVPIKRQVKFFGRPCHPTDRIAVFHNPDTLEVIEVPNAGCAKFWIEFEYGKMLFPPITNRLDLISPSIVKCAEEHFSVTFAQGCHWCA